MRPFVASHAMNWLGLVLGAGPAGVDELALLGFGGGPPGQFFFWGDENHLDPRFIVIATTREKKCAAAQPMPRAQHAPAHFCSLRAPREVRHYETGGSTCSWCADPTMYN